MKQKLSLVIIAASIFTITKPETLSGKNKKGYWLVEGNIGNISVSHIKYESIFNGNSAGTSKGQNYHISLFPRVGYFITDKLVIGATLNFNYQSGTSASYLSNGVKTSDGSYKNSSIGFAPFIRYYFAGNSKNKFFAQLGAGFNIDLVNENKATFYLDNGIINIMPTYPSKGYSIFGEALLGFNHFFTENIALNVSFGYTYTRRTDIYGSNSLFGGSTNGFPITKNVGYFGALGLKIGITIIIPDCGKKKKKDITKVEELKRDGY